ncbi:MAG: hypothetical protein R8G66_34205 [Cytophagales bacterium]|nr:hypothetical protein [Cytophagales bacterium]
MDVNFISHFNGLMAKVQEDDRLNASHVSLYLALFHYWNQSRFRNPLSVDRSELMRISKIGSANTYTKCLKDLHQWGYIEYKPSHNPFKGSMVQFLYFGKNSGNSPSSNSMQPKRITKGVNENKNYGEPL